MLFLDDGCFEYAHGVARSVVRHGHHADLLHGGHARTHPPKDGVLAVQVRRRRQRNEELALVGACEG